MSSVELTRLVNTDQLKAEIAEALPISAVASQLCDVELHRSGHQEKGLCPIHGEDTPSFYVADGKGLFHCFGCKAGGDSIELVRQVHHVGYREALVMLAEAAGVDLSRYERAPTDAERAKDEFRRGAEAWLSMLGYDDSRVSADVSVALGIRKGTGMPQQVPDYFRDKDWLFRGTIFPYLNLRGQLVGWKARHPDKVMFGTPADFPLAEPALFGLYQARPHIEGELTLVEGEWDDAVLRDHGIPNVAALGGSKFTDEHAQVLREAKIRRLTFLLDGDEGGRSAGEAIAKKYWNDPYFRVRVQLCYPGSDPEDIAKSLGPDAIRQLAASAPAALEWLLRQEFEREPRGTLSAKLDFVRWIQAEYGAQLKGLEESLVLHAVAGWLEVPEADVLDFAQADRTLLQAVDSERIVLGRAVRDGGYYVDVRKRVARTDFFVTKHQRIWQVLSEMLADGLEWDLAVIKRRGSAQGVDPEYVELLADQTDVNIGWHEDQVIDFAVRRGTQADADRFREVISDLSVPASQLIGTLTHAVTSKALGRGSASLAAISEQVDRAMDTLHERMRDPSGIVGLDLGSQFPLLTRNLNGLQPRRVVLVAATSGVGKSTMTLQFCAGLSVAQAIPTDFISLEMDTDEILFKMSSHLTGIDSHKIMGGALSPDEAKRVEQAMLRIRKSPMRIYAPDGLTPGEFILYAREAVMERRTEVFVIDYAQMMGPDPETARENRYAQLGDFAYKAKQKIARALDVCVVCCAQLKRDAAHSDKPTPEDMGDSYDLVRAADVILLVSDDEDRGAEMWVGKNRQGPGNVLIPLHFDKPNNTFREAAAAREPDYRL